MSTSSVKDFIVLGPLGVGSYGATYCVRRIQDDNTYCLKRIQIGALSAFEKIIFFYYFYFYYKNKKK